MEQDLQLCEPATPAEIKGLDGWLAEHPTGEQSEP